MKILLKWINEYVKIDDLSVKQVVDTFLNIGFEVEEIRYLGKGLEKVVVGEILDIEKHPNADKLKVCKVNIGSEKLKIITAATNVYEDMLFPLALDGADLPCGMNIKNGEIRGVESQGMMCSFEELCINNDVLDGCEVDGILDLKGSGAEAGDRLDKVLGLDDYLFDVAVTANRPDCNSIYGLARELATALNRKLKELKLTFRVNKSGRKVDVKIADEAVCPLYMATSVVDVKIKKSSQKIRRRLFNLGHKSINNVVDLTNYVLLEVGQPQHAFDADKLNGSEIFVRDGIMGEDMIGLDGKNYKLDEKHLLICDNVNVLAIAGAIGGQDSAISYATKNIVLESARFSRARVRTSARDLNISTDSSKRFEKGVDFDSVDVGRKRFLNLIDAQKIGTIIENKTQNKFKQKQIKLEVDKINALLGINVPTNFIARTLGFLGFEVNLEKKFINIPLFREDVDNFADIAEEVIRFYGYDKLNEDSITALPMTRGGITKHKERLNKIEDLLNAFGAYGIKNFSFVSPDMSLVDKKTCLKIINPLSEDYSLMRGELVSSVLKTVKLNLAKGNNCFRIYEIDNIFVKNKKAMSDIVLPLEQKSLCLVMAGEHEDFYKLKDLVGRIVGEHEIKRSEDKFLHPGISAEIILDGQRIGSYGKIHPSMLDESIYILQVNLEPILKKEEETIVFKALARYPSVVRDIALIFDEETTIGEIEGQIYACAISMCSQYDILKKVELVDIYQGGQIEKGKKSAAFRLYLLDETKTLIDEVINGFMNTVIKHLTDKFNAKLR
ncbi:MAG: phenylalanine--tRNA ligase subunit beta [Firmicutes bacterium]|nr:phenylalanine--tRNA ligase subunit beta [Bacillota bacterium]